LSPDVIKKREFHAQFTPLALPGDAVSAVAERFSSLPAQLERLEAELAEKERAHRQALAQAEERGRADAARRAEDSFGHAARSLVAAAEELRRRAAEEVTLVEHDVARLSAAIAAKIVRREIAHDDEFVTRLVRRCLLKVVGASRVTVRVHPSDHDRIARAERELAGEGTAGLALTIVSDRRVDRGGCIVETPNFVVDGRIQAQRQAAAQAMMGEIE